MKHAASYKIGALLILSGGLLGACLSLYCACREKDAECVRLRAGLDDCRSKELQSVLVQRVSAQMEEIAYQQKDIAEKRKEEAERQTRKAARLQQQAEAAREKAFKAQREAEKAYRMADAQKEIAMQRQRQAEQAKKTADTLARLALGRSLGSMSATQYQSGNTALAALLAYAAWEFTGSCQGDVYHPAVFNALSLCCRQDTLWYGHQGALTAIARTGSGTSSGLVTAGKYGEILHWEHDGKTGFRPRTFLADARYDFRGLCAAPGGTCYALSYDSQLVAATGSGFSVFPLPLKEAKGLIPLASTRFLAVGADALCIFDSLTSQVQTCYSPDAAICYAGRSANRIYVFLEDGRTALLSAQGEFVRFMPTLPEDGGITAFCPLSGERYALGCRNGNLLICDAGGKILYRLIGHRSAVTAIRSQGGFLFSSSYDRTLRLWDIRKGRAEAAVIFTHTAWIHTFELAPGGKYIFMGDEQGRLYRIPVSPRDMAATIRDGLERDFTREEWEYYIGKQIPFQAYCSKNRRP